MELLFVIGAVVLAFAAGWMVRHYLVKTKPVEVAAFDAAAKEAGKKVQKEFGKL